MPVPLDIEYEALPLDILKVSRSLYSAMRNASWYICALLASGSFRGNVGVTVQATPADYLLGLGELSCIRHGSARSEIEQELVISLGMFYLHSEKSFHADV